MDQRDVVETIQLSSVENPTYSLTIPIRDRCDPSFRNCLQSVELQTLSNVELILVDYGSTQENHEKLLEMAPDCTIYRCKTDAPWNLSLARNIGLRRSHALYSGTLDADLILEPNLLDLTHQVHNIYYNCYITTRVILLSPNAIASSSIKLPRDYEALSNAPYMKRAEGWGGFVSAATSWWYASQGFDERMIHWGWEDVDMWKRIARARLTRSRLQKIGHPDSEIYHQYHPNVQAEAVQQQNTEVFEAITLNEDYAKHTRGILRNDENWGLWVED